MIGSFVSPQSEKNFLNWNDQPILKVPASWKTDKEGAYKKSLKPRFTVKSCFLGICTLFKHVWPGLIFDGGAERD